VALALVGLAFAAPAVGAHGTDATADGAPTDDATADNWAARMAAQMTEDTRPGSVEWMAPHTGVTVDEMGHDMADGHHGGANDGHHAGADGGHHAGADGGHHGGMYGQGHC